MHLKKRLIAVAAVLVMAAAVLYGSTFVTGDMEETDASLTWKRKRDNLFLVFRRQYDEFHQQRSRVFRGERGGARDSGTDFRERIPGSY